MNRTLQNLLIRNRTKRPESRIVAEGGESVIYIYDAIVSTDADAAWFGGVSAESLVPQIRGLTGDITLRINSPGGDVFGANAISSALRSVGGKVTAHVDGLAASAATAIASAADEVHMAEGSMFMVHRAWTIALGNMNDFLSAAGLLEKVDNQLAQAYAARTGGTSEDMLALMDAETWMTAEEAVEAGFANSVTAGAKASARFDLSAFANAPKMPEPEPAPGPAMATEEHRDRQRQRLRLVASM